MKFFGKISPAWKKTINQLHGEVAARYFSKHAWNSDWLACGGQSCGIGFMYIYIFEQSLAFPFCRHNLIKEFSSAAFQLKT